MPKKFPPIFWAVFLSFLALASAVGLLACGGYLIAFAAERPPFAALALGAVGVRFFGLSRGVLRYGERLASHAAAFAFVERVRARLYAALEPLVPYRLGGRAEGEILNAYAADAAKLEGAIPRVALPLAVAALAAFACGAVLLWLSPRLALVFAFAVLSICAVSCACYLLLKPRAAAEAAAQKSLAAIFQDAAHNLQDIQAAGYGDRIHQILTNKLSLLAKIRERKHWILLASEFLCALPVLFVLWAVWAWGAGESLPHTVAVSLGFIAAFEAFQVLPLVAYHAAECEAVKHSAPSGSAQETRAPSVRETDCPLNICDLDFAYPGSRQVFHCAHLRLERGQVHVLRGPTGSGKTALAGAVAGFLESTGTLERTENWTLIEQEPCLFTGTLRDNLLLACSAADAADDAECGRALRLAGLADFPLDTWLGERGRALSGGERQRVAIARAILRRAHLVIADEACAHLPLPEEKKIFQMFQSLPEQPAVLWISHRL